MRDLYIECYSGISGDMVVASLLDLGADYEKLQNVLKTIKIESFRTEVKKVIKSGVSANDFAVIIDEKYDNHDHDMEYLFDFEGIQDSEDAQKSEHKHEHTHNHVHEHIHEHRHEHDHEHNKSHDKIHKHEHRGLQDVLEIINNTEMTENAKKIAENIFKVLGEAEAKAHGTTIENVHFHEVGAIDSIVDIISTAVCIDDLNVDNIIISELYEGKGKIRCQHGVLPIPVPAVLNIINSNNIKVHFTEQEAELITPTGAAIAAALKTKDKLPSSFGILKIGIGAGKRNYKNPSMVRAMLIQSKDKILDEGIIEKNTLYKIESNIDDCTGETLGYVMNRLFDAGARDVSFTPVFMKKNRPAYQINIICDENLLEKLEKIIFKETTTIGIRRIKIERSVLARESRDIETSLGTAKIKICELYGEKRIYPEYDNVVYLAEKNNKSFQDVFKLVEREAYGKFND